MAVSYVSSEDSIDDAIETKGYPEVGRNNEFEEQRRPKKKTKTTSAIDPPPGWDFRKCPLAFPPPFTGEDVVRETTTEGTNTEPLVAGEAQESNNHCRFTERICSSMPMKHVVKIRELL